MCFVKMKLILYYNIGKVTNFNSRELAENCYYTYLNLLIKINYLIQQLQLFLTVERVVMTSH